MKITLQIMSTLKTTITLASTELFPSTVSFAKVKEYTVDGNSDFQTTEIPANDTMDLYSTTTPSGTSGIVYFYCESSSENTGNLVILIQNRSNTDTTSVMQLVPGAVSFIPLYAGDYEGMLVTISNDTPNACTVSYFFGEAD